MVRAKENKERIYTYTDPDVKRQLKIEAAIRGVTLETLVDKIFQDWMQRQKQKKEEQGS